MQNYGNYQPMPQPYADRLTQLQNQYNQAVNVPQVGAQMSLPQPQVNQGLLWVSGEVGAKSYLVAPNSTVLLMDSDAQRFYLKSADNAGMPNLRIFEYTEVTNAPHNAPQTLNTDFKELDSKYVKGEYYDTVLMEMQGGYSERDYAMMEDDYAMRGRKRDRMGRYSREDGMRHNDRMRRGGRRDYSMNDGGYSMYDRYMDAKQSYRSNQSMDGKQKLMESLEDYMDDFTEKIKEMYRDSETGEERELIGKFMSKLQNIR